MKHKLSGKKSQSEAVGFVVIILLVVIIGVIFLGISLRKSSEVITTDARIANFLSASFDYKTSSSCYQESEPFYRSLGDTAKDCYAQIGGSTSAICPNGETPCSFLNMTYTEMLSRFMPAGTLNYYKLSFTYNSSAAEKTFQKIEWGASSKCISRKAGRNYISLGSGEEIIAELDICEA